ncbi:SDR family NAD(P)-dependent oxidoreductase [Granulicella sp. 5B5]|uniref:oxidoreductase n=1 Tax=Granulicella sp. 5B5 TaxID=1617967 RepID=UPI0015F37AD9|nr:oxidoreductase [Granulicella sp. 5B5]QMV18701.1 SDR family NAD(P)-dependent oxidoreductase [Granulicella sp. 5B5]
MATTHWTSAQIPTLNGKTVLITGANSGIGYQAALELARHGAHVLLGCRSRQKGEQALARLRSESPGASAELVLLDVSLLSDVRRFATEFFARGVALDILINNAGVMALNPRQVTPEGFERQFATNHLGHFALTGLLLPALGASPAPRVVTVASIAHQGGKIHFDDLQLARGYTPWGAYNQSKLANILFARELARRAAGTKLLSLPVHPGVSQTSIVANGPGDKDLKTFVLFKFARFLTQPDAAGALPTLYAATSPEARSGDYIGPDGFMEMKGYPTVVKPRPHALDQSTGERLWTVSEQLTGVVYPAFQ